MTDLVQATDSVYVEWLSYLSGAGSDAVTVFGNERQAPNGVDPEASEDPWYRVSFRESSGGRANLNGVTGSRKYERTGFLAIQCFAPVRGGEQTAKLMAESARDRFEDRRHETDSRIVYLDATIRPQPTDGKWDIVLLEVEVEYTDTK